MPADCRSGYLAGDSVGFVRGLAAFAELPTWATDALLALVGMPP